MKKVTIILAVSAILLGINNIQLDSIVKVKDENIKIIENENDGLYEELKNTNQQVREYKNKIDKLEQENMELSKYRFYDIPLTYKQQKFIFDLAEEKNLSFELIISIIKNESNFQTDLVSKTSDYGIMQLNSKNHKFFAKLSGLETYDVFDFYDNVTMGVNYLVYLRNNLIKQGITNQEDLTIYLLNSYNMGEMGFKNYVKRTGMTTRVYNQKIIEYKGLLEQSLNT